MTGSIDDDSPSRASGNKGKILLWVGALGALALIVVIGAIFLATRSGEASSDDAIEEFRDAPAAENQSPGVPPPGVYDYEVTGSETIIQGPIEITRGFPGSAPAIVTHTEQGYDWELRLSSDRTETIGYVVDDRGASAVMGRSELSVAGVSSNVEREWTPPLWRFPIEPEVGQEFSERATGSDGTRLRIESEVIGNDTLRVSGEPVEVTTIEATLTFSGDTTGVVEERVSYAPESGLLVRFESEEDFSGDGQLRSTWDARLTALEPAT